MRRPKGRKVRPTIDRGVLLLTFIKSHRSQATAVPTVRNVNSPTILHPSVQASQNPVEEIQNHHAGLNDRYLCW